MIREDPKKTVRENEEGSVDHHRVREMEVDEQ